MLRCLSLDSAERDKGHYLPNMRERVESMILLIAKFLTWAFKIDLQKAQHIAMYAVIGLAAAILLTVVISLRGCSSKSAKVDLDTVNKINNGNATEVRNQVREMVEDNAEVTTTVDNRTTIAETNVVERNRLLDEKVKAVEQKINQAHAEGRNVTQEELQCELVPSDCQ